MKWVFSRLGLATGLLLVALPASAHHSLARFDLDRQVTLAGVVTKLLWANPHVYVYVRTGDEADEGVIWAIGAVTPNKMIRSGWTADSLAPGDRVTVIGYPARDQDTKAAWGTAVLKADGTLLTMPHPRTDYEALTAAPRTRLAAADLSGQWLLRWDPDVAEQFLRPRTSWSLTDKGVAALESYDQNLDAPSRDCVEDVVPFVMVIPDMLSIELGEDVTLIRQESQVDRTVHMNLDSHDGAPYSHQGHSIGWWEDDVLVVDTTHFTDHRKGNAVGLPSGPQKHLVERFALSADRTQLNYSFRLEDPEYLAEPVTATLTLTYRPDLDFVSVPCDLESARRYLEE